MRSHIFLATLLALAVAAPAASAAPSLRLFAADPSVRVHRAELDATLHVGLWVAAEDGDFRVHASRPDYGAWQARQVDSTTGAVVRPIPADLIDGADGFKRFVELRFQNERGRTVARRAVNFCPGGAYERVSDDGPLNPTYLGFCGTGFPFTRGTVWGVDRGWASSLAGGGFFGEPTWRPLNLRAGRYRVLASIREPFRALLGIPAEEAEASVRLRVTGRRGGRGLPPIGPPPPGARMAAQEPLSAPQETSPDPSVRPDLVALPPWEVDARRRRGRDLLQFSATPWNAGPAPLIVEGYRDRGEDVMEARQYFVDASGAATGSAPVGGMKFHDRRGHHHWHFLQFVSYTMRELDGGAVVRARKQSFCLASTDPVDLTMLGAEIAPTLIGLGSACGDGRSIWLRQVLPAGWGDTYTAGIAGQHFDISDVPNGRYLLEMHVNPTGELYETDTSNNVAQRHVTLRGRPGRRHVRVAPWNGIDR